MKRRWLALLTLLILSLLLTPGCAEKATGTLDGQVTIGPLSPVVQPGATPEPVPPKVYAARKIMVYNARGSKLIQEVTIQPDGHYRTELPAGTYTVSLVVPPDIPPDSPRACTGH